MEKAHLGVSGIMDATVLVTVALATSESEAHICSLGQNIMFALTSGRALYYSRLMAG